MVWKFHTILVCSAIGTMLGACKGDDKKTPAAKPLDEPARALTAHQLCATYLSQQDNANLCLQRPVRTGADYDEQQMQKRCRPGSEGIVWASDLLEAVEAGRVLIDWQLARQCLTESRGLRASHPGHELLASPAWTELKEDACTSFYAGTVIEGGACEDDWDCVEGAGCYSLAPWEAGTARCLKPAVVDEACSDYRPCEYGSRCGEAGRCVALIPGGGACDVELWGADCLSEVCEGEPPICAPVPTMKQIGEPCAPAAGDCAGECVGCRAERAGAPTVCAQLGGEGSYCDTWYDCVDDLGCVDNACTAVAAGERCGPAVESVCAPDLFCVPAVACWEMAGDQVRCEAEKTCAYDPTEGLCEPIEGLCVVLPDTGDCLHGFACADTSFCAPTTGQCQPLAVQGGLCSADGTTAPPCAAGLGCDGGSCRPVCELREDCGESEYCDFTVEYPVCAPVAAERCTSTDGCPQGSYCDVSGFVDPCASVDDRAACDEEPMCAYQDRGFCVVTCWDHDGDPEACRDKDGCTYSEDNGWCDGEVECYARADAANCSTEAGCRWEPDGYCQLAQAPEGQCQPQLEVGEPCDEDLPESCLSQDCSADERGQYRCAVELSGCNRDASFIRFALLFGAVWAVGSGSRRKQR